MRLFLALLLALPACVAEGNPDDFDDAADREAESIRGGYVGSFNRPSQGHANDCVRIKGDAIPLRYADGSLTGFSVTKSMLKYTDTGECPDGTLRLDAREVIKTADGRRLYFHRGGYGYQNGSNVKYGHVWIADLADSPRVDPGIGNGAPCGASNNPATEGHYRVRVKALPTDMHFCKTKGDCNSPEETNGYSSYGDPAQQGAPSSIHYTYLNWSWLNVAGGGVVRALLPEGQAIHRCDVPSIKLDTVREDGTKNGWVRAIYVKTSVGGEWIYGWVVHSHYFNGDPATTYHVSKL